MIGCGCKEVSEETEGTQKGVEPKLTKNNKKEIERGAPAAAGAHPSTWEGMPKEASKPGRPSGKSQECSEGCHLEISKVKMCIPNLHF